MLPLLNSKQKFNSIIKTQEELDNFKPDQDGSGIFVIKTPGLKLNSDIYLRGTVKLVIDAELDFSGRFIDAFDDSRVTTYHGGKFKAYQKGRIWADGKADILLGDNAAAEVYGSESVVVATDESSVESYGDFTIFAYDKCQIKFGSGFNRKIIDNRKSLNQYIFYRLNEKKQAVLFYHDHNDDEQVVRFTDLYHFYSISRLNFVCDIVTESIIVGTHYKMLNGIKTAGLVISLASAKKLGLTTDGIRIQE